MTQQKPSIGRIVHQQHPDHGCLAAAIVRVGENGDVDLDRFQHPDVPGGLLLRVPAGEPGQAGTWHFPERV